MDPHRVRECVQVLFAFVLAGALQGFHWNPVAARRVQNWVEGAMPLDGMVAIRKP